MAEAAGPTGWSSIPPSIAPPATSPLPDPALNDATRYLCAGAELDETYADQIMSEVFGRPNRAVAPSYGIDLVPIVRHCLIGRRRRAVRDMVILGLLAFEVALFPLPSLIAMFAAWLARRGHPWLAFSIASPLVLVGAVATLLALTGQTTAHSVLSTGSLLPFERWL